VTSSTDATIAHLDECRQVRRAPDPAGTEPRGWLRRMFARAAAMFDGVA
jgi:hypothetical protein